MEAKLVIDGRLDGLNEYTKVGRTPRIGTTLQSKMKRENQEIVGWYIKAQISNIHFETPVKLQFHWYEENRRRDIDNICFSKKFILDALVENGIIPNDNQQYVHGFTDEFFVDKENPRIEVLIEEVLDE